MSFRANVNRDSLNENFAKQIPNGERFDRYYNQYQEFLPQNPFESYDGNHAQYQPADQGL